MTIIRDAGAYLVVHEYVPSKPPKKNPNARWEIRKSKRDGTFYCSCPSWITVLNKHRKLGLKGEVCCKHLVRYKNEGLETEPVLAMTVEGHELLLRNATILTDVRLDNKTMAVRRNI